MYVAATAIYTVIAAIMFSEASFAHDPDAPDLDVPEIGVSAERPVAASSQQFIPDKEYVMQPQGRPARLV